MKIGTVKFFNSEKGFGFIEVEGEKDVFVHSSSLSGFSIQEGDKVQFDVEKGTKVLKQPIFKEYKIAS